MATQGDTERKDSALQRELARSRPFDGEADEAAIGLLRTASLVRRRLAAVVEPHGLTYSQYNALRILRGAGGPLPTMTIAARLIEETPNVTRIVNHLERQGLLARERCTEDQRQVLCTITPAGLDLLGEIDAPIEEATRTALEGLRPLQQRALIDLLDQAREVLRR